MDIRPGIGHVDHIEILDFAVEEMPWDVNVYFRKMLKQHEK